MTNTEPLLIAERYRLVTELASGGMGVVWKGWDKRLHRTVAIKQLRLQPGLSESEAAIARNRAMREARNTARLHHPHAVPVYDVVEHDGQPCLIMEFLPSISLQEAIKQRGTLPPGEVARIGSELAKALTAAHRAGIVHRDVKPGNVLLAEDGTTKLTDFGISHALGDATLTATGMLTGTPAYLAPEVARGQPASFASDVFSLGSTLYTAMEGVPPFGKDDNAMAVLHRVASGQYRRPQNSGPLTPLLSQMLTVDPAARPSMTNVSRTLATLHTESSAADTQREKAAPAVPVVAPIPEPSTETVPAAPELSTDTSDPIAAATDPVVPEPEPEAEPVVPEPEPEPVVAAAPEPEPVAAAAPEPEPVAPEPEPVVAEPEPVADAEPVAAEPVAPAPPPLPPVRPTRTDLSPVDEPGPPGPRRPRRVIAALVTGAVVIAAAVLAFVLTRPDNGANQGTGSASKPAAPAPGHSTTHAPKTTPTASHTTSHARSTTQASTPAGSTTASRTSPAASTAAQLAQAITDYYALMPGDVQGGWSRLTPAYQQGTAKGYANYRQFWSQFSSVATSGVSGQAPDTAIATITYTKKSGGQSVEHTQFKLVKVGGELKINDSSVLG